jgi:glucosamine--fructose-6-phosphate aminotransferase (isomerizing)
MCGIIGVVGGVDIGKKATKGLEILEYRGYDSAGIGWSGLGKKVKIRKTLDGVISLVDFSNEIKSGAVIGHSRWATHGVVKMTNAHPHNVNDEIAIVHNGIIENYKELKQKLTGEGYNFLGESDTECIVYNIKSKYNGCWYTALTMAIDELEGAYAIAMIVEDEDCIYIAKNGSPLIIGKGTDENFISSSIDGLNGQVEEFIIMDDGECGKITANSIDIINMDGENVHKRVHIAEKQDTTVRAPSGGYMLKEINEQPDVIRNTIMGGEGLTNEVYGDGVDKILSKVGSIKIIACGTSHNAGMLGKYWIEEYCGIKCDVEIASEFIYRDSVINKDELVIFISQSGETADTIGAIKKVIEKHKCLATMAICNSKYGELVRLSDFSFITRAGIEIGVASTKAFTTQLIGLITLINHIIRNTGSIDEVSLIETDRLIMSIRHILERKEQISGIAGEIAKAKSCLFIGRDVMYPIAMEGALKLKEISYIHAEAYAGGELKHGPIALIDEKMPVIALSMASSDIKIMSNIEEIRTRGGNVFVFDECGHNKIISPILMAVYMQLLSYQVATILGNNVDRPRNLAKAVTVE